MAKSKRGDPVPRPTRKSEYALQFTSREASVGWLNLVATQTNKLQDAWDDLTANPIRNDPECHPLKGELATVTHEGVSHVRRQYELAHGARIWYFVIDHRVLIHYVHTRHPNETK
ncbi:hypothetical protein GCM10022198_24440 [Klugiella xanthotipulae]|uniref:Type II toxin-antitoxin system RelE/ParE family toxin n=1 Tax=Klugiella xanthotipulae TaxID=244735 RepID=A0A543I6A4_9MICO|nr:hypothetical protein FB466_0935 [Klugiella xanthotipulae]